MLRVEKPIIQNAIARGLFGSSVVQGSGMFAAFLLHLVLARTLGRTEYGTYVYLLAWINVAVVFAKFGTDRALVRYVAEASAKDKWNEVRQITNYLLKLVFKSSIIVAFVTTILFLLVNGNASAHVYYTGIWAVGVLFGMAVCFWQKGGLLGLRLIVYSKLPTEIVRPVLIGALILLFASVSGSLSAVTAMKATLAATFCTILLGAWFWRTNVPQPDGADAGLKVSALPSLSALFPFVLIAVARTAMQYVDVLMVGAIHGPDEVAAYSVAARLCGMVAFGAATAAPVLQPYVSRFFATGCLDSIRRTVSLVTLAVGAFTVMTSLFLLFFGDLVLSLFGRGFKDAYFPMVILVFGQVINTSCGFNGVLLSMTGHQGLASKGLWLGAGVNIVLNAALVPSFGALGAATATTISMALWNLILVYFVRKELGMNSTIFAAAHFITGRQ
jgi:O-antigen/teichoic acid export membrane protein